MTQPTNAATGQLVAALVVAQDAADHEATALVVNTLTKRELRAGLIAACSLAVHAMRRTPGGVAAWLRAYHRIDGSTL